MTPSVNPQRCIKFGLEQRMTINLEQIYTPPQVFATVTPTKAGGWPKNLGESRISPYLTAMRTQWQRMMSTLKVTGTSRRPIRASWCLMYAFRMRKKALASSCWVWRKVSFKHNGKESSNGPVPIWLFRVASFVFPPVVVSCTIRNAENCRSRWENKMKKVGKHNQEQEKPHITRVT